MSILRSWSSFHIIFKLIDIVLNVNTMYYYANDSDIQYSLCNK